MYSEEPDGSAMVRGLHVRSLLEYQHVQVNTPALNMLSVFALAMAREHGWLQTEAAVRGATRGNPRSNDARPLIENEGHAYAGEPTTIFYAGVDVALEGPPHFNYPPTPSTLLYETHLRVVHVGTSSYTLHARVRDYTEGEDAAAPLPLGSVTVTCVQVDKQTRAVTPLGESRRAVLQRSHDMTVAAAAPMESADLAFDKLARIDVKELLQACPVLLPNSTPAAMHLADGPIEATDRFTFRRLVPLRESDMDFNLHLNQLVTMRLVHNAFRGAAADARCVYPELLRRHPGATVLKADLLVRRYRIDYLREVPMACEATEIVLYPADDGEKAKLLEMREGELAKLHFFTLGVPAIASPERFLATVGHLYVYI